MTDPWADTRTRTNAPYHLRFALLTLESQDVSPIYRITCTCGWQSQWTASWRKSLDSHVYRADPLPHA